VSGSAQVFGCRYNCDRRSTERRETIEPQGMCLTGHRRCSVLGRGIDGRRPAAWGHPTTAHGLKIEMQLQPFSQKAHTPTLPKEFEIGLYDPAEADLEHIWNCCSAGVLGQLLYSVVGSGAMWTTRSFEEMTHHHERDVLRLRFVPTSN